MADKEILLDALRFRLPQHFIAFNHIHYCLSFGIRLRYKRLDSNLDYYKMKTTVINMFYIIYRLSPTQILQVQTYSVTLFHPRLMKLGVRVLTRPLLLLPSFVDLTLGVVGAVIVPLLEDFDRAVCELNILVSEFTPCIPLSDFIRVNRAIIQVSGFWRFSTSRFWHRSFHISTSVLYAVKS